MTVIDGAANTSATISAGTYTLGIAVDPVLNQIYVPDQASNNLRIFDGETNTSIATVNTGSSPYAVAVNPATNKIYVANSGSSNVTVIDGVTKLAIATVSAGTSPWAIAVNPLTNRIYVANSGSGNLTVIDGATDTLLATVSVGTTPYGVAVNPGTNRIYVSNYNSNNVTVIDGASNTAIATVAAGSYPIEIAVSPLTNQIYVANTGDSVHLSTVTVIDGATNTATTISAGRGPAGIVVSPVTNDVYVANAGSNNVTIITPAAIQSIPLSVQLSGVDDGQTVGGLAIFATKNPSPSLSATVTSAYSTSGAYGGTGPNPPATALYYQLDTALGRWLPATATTAAGANPAGFTIALSDVPQGVHTLYVYAAYGDEGTAGASSQAGGSSPEIGNLTAFTFAVLQEPAETTTLVTADVNPQNVGSSVTFTASVAPVSGGETPTGTVTFSNGPTQLGQVPLDGTGHATYATSLLAAGSHTITASYSGDASFAPSSGSMTEQILALPHSG